MRITEAAALLTICAAFDNRKPDEDQAQAWALALDGFRLEDCREAIVNHYRTSREWIMPSNVIEGAKDLRNKRYNDFIKRMPNPYLTPPAELDDDPAAANRWICDMNQRIRNGEITEPEQVERARGELNAHDVIAELGLVGREVPGE